MPHCRDGSLASDNDLLLMMVMIRTYAAVVACRSATTPEQVAELKRIVDEELPAPNRRYAWVQVSPQTVRGVFRIFSFSMVLLLLLFFFLLIFD